MTITLPRNFHSFICSILFWPCSVIRGPAKSPTIRQFAKQRRPIFRLCSSEKCSLKCARLSQDSCTEKQPPIRPCVNTSNTSFLWAGLGGLKRLYSALLERQLRGSHTHCGTCRCCSSRNRKPLLTLTLHLRPSTFVLLGNIRHRHSGSGARTLQFQLLTLSVRMQWNWKPDLSSRFSIGSASERFYRSQTEHTAPSRYFLLCGLFVPPSRCFTEESISPPLKPTARPSWLAYFTTRMT